MSEDCVSMETTAIARQGSRTCPWSSMGLILSREDRLGVEGEVYEVQYVGLCQDTEHRVIFLDYGPLFRRIQHVWSTGPIGKSVRINRSGRKHGTGAPAGGFTVYYGAGKVWQKFSQE